MKKLVIIPGGFHPFHAGHLALYNAAREAFPSADVFVAATADTSTRPFPFKLKKTLAQAAGVPGNRFIQVKSPFRAEEITQMYDPKDTQLIFVRSEKDLVSQPKPGGVKKDGSPSYLQPYKRTGLESFDQHAYMAYLPVATFGPGMTSATEIRAKWPEMEPEQKIGLIKTLYPMTAGNDAAAAKIVAMFDQTIGGTVSETAEIKPAGGLGTYTPQGLERAVADHMQEVITYLKAGAYDKVDYMLYRWGVIESKVKALKDYYEQIKAGQTQVDEDYIDEKWSDKYKRSINCDNPKGFSQRAHCAGRKK